VVQGGREPRRDGRALHVMGHPVFGIQRRAPRVALLLRPGSGEPGPRLVDALQSPATAPRSPLRISTV
jgi:hypothetical protein